MAPESIIAIFSVLIFMYANASKITSLQFTASASLHQIIIQSYAILMMYTCYTRYRINTKHF